MERSAAEPRAYALRLALFAALACVGVYGVLTYSVLRRTRKSEYEWHWVPHCRCFDW
jgi:hypothetical protein